MSRVSERVRVAARASALVAILLLSAASTGGQSNAVGTYVCQTPTFWCVFQGPPGANDGTTCSCTTTRASVGGYSIDPTRVAGPPPLPRPQPSQQRQDASARSPPQAPAVIARDDCYAGLGNCLGSFLEAAKANQQRVPAPFGAKPPGNSSRPSARSNGRTRTFTGTLAQGASRRITLDLRSARSYTISGECDADCQDLDFVLRRGTAVIDDDTTGDSPELSVTVDRVGTYALEVRMKKLLREQVPLHGEGRRDHQIVLCLAARGERRPGSHALRIAPRKR